MKNQRKTTKKNAALYVRANHMDGLSPQAILGTHYALSKGYNVPLTQIYTDVCTGNNEQRPGFNKLLKESRKKKFDTVIVTSMDRLARKPEQLFMMNIHLMMRNITLKVAN